MPSLQIQEYYTARELAEAIGVSAKTITRWLRHERIPTIPRKPRKGSRIRVSLREIVRGFPEVMSQIVF